MSYWSSNCIVYIMFKLYIVTNTVRTSWSQFIRAHYSEDEYIYVSLGRSLTIIYIYLRLTASKVQNLPMTRNQDLTILSSGYEFLAVTTGWQHRSLLAKSFAETIKVPYQFYLLRTIFSNFVNDLRRSSFEGFSEFRSYQISLARGATPVPNTNHKLLVGAVKNYFQLPKIISSGSNCSRFLNFKK